MICQKCNIEKDESLFYRNLNRKTGFDHYCKECRKSYIKQWSKTEVGFNCRKTARRNFYLNNKDYELSKSRQWRRGVRKGTPPWITAEHLKEIASIYNLARDCRLITGEAYEVDHIIPINGKNVCGLHVPWNLQVLPRDLNSSKSNRFIE